ncbi:hypothetical protein KVR01_004780 [Diaporthe batatas]|uniref:uncharacterized protein n=1 Tax=Diaporthe batatas TaxID=748121 RepID=UPI001D043A6E|nr:uncharacterized protein KVR01_004780 [Diaporthe batatas]KAG8166228.1 hypothetical protein KVR01_004780 [Diaporthe batatas]
MHLHLRATTEPTSLRPIGYAQTILAFAILLGLGCMAAVGLRTWQRVRERKFHVDDGLIWLGLVFNLAQYAITAWGTTVGIGSPDVMLYRPMLRIAGHVLIWVNVTNVLALGFTKASICVTLLRLIKGTCHRKTAWTLWLVMAAVSLSTATSLIFIIVHSASDAGRRKGVGAWQTLIYPFMGLFILVDITLAVVPISIVRGLNMKTSLKLSTGAILALGGVACVASVLCIPPQADVGAGSSYRDYLYRQGSVLFWQNIETGLGIMASCLPALRRLIKSFDADGGERAPGRLPYYRTDFSAASGHTPANSNMEYLRLDPHASPDQKYGQLQIPRAILASSPRDSQRQHLGGAGRCASGYGNV